MQVLTSIDRNGFFHTIVIQAGIGVAAGAAGAFAGPASTIGGVLGRMAMKRAIGGVSSVLSTAGERGVENLVYGKHEMLFEGFAKNLPRVPFLGLAEELSETKWLHRPKCSS